MAKSARFLVVVSTLLLLVVAGAEADYVDVWVQETSGTLEDLNDVCAVSQQVAWAVGDNGVIRRRNVSGVWETIAGPGADWDLHGVFFADADLGWIVGEMNNPDGAHEIHTGIVLRTLTGSDPSPHWIDYVLLPPSPSPPAPFYDVYFVDNMVGWISAGNGWVLTTRNGGVLWEWESVNEAPDSLSNCILGLWAENGDKARVVSDNHGILARTTDGGENWDCEEPFETDASSHYWIPGYGYNPIAGEYSNFNISCSDMDNFYVALSEGYVGKSGWDREEHVLPSPEWFKGVWAEDAGSHVYAVGSSGTIVHSTNNGDDWRLEYMDPDFHLNDVHFADTYAEDSHIGWAVGTGGVILRDSTREVCWLPYGAEYTIPDEATGYYTCFFLVNDECSGIDYFELYQSIDNPGRGGPWYKDDPLTEEFFQGQTYYQVGGLHVLCLDWHFYYTWLYAVYEDGWKQLLHSDIGYLTFKYGCECEMDMPDPPANLQVTDTPNDQGDKLHLSWDQAPGADEGYYVYRATESDGQYELIEHTSNTECYDYDVLTGKEYYYHVRSAAIPCPGAWAHTVVSDEAAGSGTPTDNVDPAPVVALQDAKHSWYDRDNEILHFEWEDLDDPTLGGYWICPEGVEGIPLEMSIANTSPIDRTFYTLEGDFKTYDDVIVGVLGMDRSRNMKEENWTKWLISVGFAMASSDEATAYNNSRRSCYGGSSWHEAYWSEDDQGVENVLYKNRAEGDTWNNEEMIGVGQNPSMALNSYDSPCVVWRQNVESKPPFVTGGLYSSGKGALGWSGPHTLYTTTAENASVGPPSLLVTDQNMGFVTWEAREQSPGGPSWQDAVFFGEFNTLSASPQWLYFARIDVDDMVSTSDSLQASPSVALDLSGQPHVVWTRKEEGEIYYSYRTVTGWSQPQNVSESPEKDSRNPRISLQGDWLRVVWEEEGDPGVYKTYLWDSWKDIGMSRTQKIEIATGCLEPVIDGNVISMTKEVGDDYEIYASVFDHDDYSWDAGKNISESPHVPSRYSDVLVPTKTVSDLGKDAYYYGIWSEGGGDHYWLRFTEETIEDQGDLPYYAFNLGQGQPSPVTEQRDGFIDFGPEPHQKVDYDSTNVKYNMNLEPQGFEYRLGLSYYHESQGTWYEVLKVDDVVLDTAQVPSGQRVYVEEWVPESAILDGNIVVEVSGVPGNIAHCGELRLYQYLPAGRKCGPQNTGKHRALVPDAVRLARILPNPFAGMTAIQLEIPDAQKVILRVYDTAGRLVKTLLDQDIPTGLHTVAWNGTDDRGRTQPSGVYFIRLSNDIGSQSEKVILLR